MKQIEIIQGPASALYGADAFIGVINIITKNSDNSKPSSDFSFNLGSIEKPLDTKEFSFNAITKKNRFGMTLSGTIYNQTGPDFTDFIKTAEYTQVNRQLRKEMLDNLNPYRDDDRAYNTNVDLMYSITDKADAAAGMVFLRDEDGGGFENPEIAYTDFNLILEQVLTYLTGSYRFTGYPVKLSIDASRNDENLWIRFQSRENTGDNPPYVAVTNVEDSKLHKINAQIDITPKKIPNYLIVGFGYQENNIGEPAHTGLTGFDSTLMAPLLGRYLYPPKGIFAFLRPYLDQNITYAYLQDQHSFFKGKLQITLGGRYDYHNIYGGITNLRSGIYYKFLENYAVKALYGEAFREPTLFELFHNPDLKPAEMRTWELSFHFNPIKGIAGQLVYYNNHAFKIIEERRGTTGLGGIPVNAGVKDVTGIEGLIKWQHNRLRGNIWYNYERNPDDQDFMNVAEHKLGAEVSYSIMNNVSVSLQGRYTDKIKTNAFDGNGDDIVITIPEYGSYNLILLAQELSFPAFPEFDLSFSIYNLLDERNLFPNVRGPNPSRYLAEGRSFFINAGVSF